ncbi:MAG: AAA family ATPase [Baekduiaceae bacterium]
MPDLDLLERDTEMGLLDELLASAAASEGRFLLIEGPAGIGKSRVLAEIRRRAGSRVRVLSARGGELEGAFPFGVVRQLFEGVIADPELAERVLAGAAAPARDIEQRFLASTCYFNKYNRCHHYCGTSRGLIGV